MSDAGVPGKIYVNRCFELHLTNYVMLFCFDLKVSGNKRLIIFLINLAANPETDAEFHASVLNFTGEKRKKLLAHMAQHDASQLPI